MRIQKGSEGERTHPATTMAAPIQLREVQRIDVEDFFVHQLDDEANYMAAFTSKDPSDRDAFTNRWDRILSTESITKKTIVADGRVVGHVLKYVSDDLQQPEITYWIAKSDWGKGYATRAVSQFLELVPDRPIYARAVADNNASIRVLEKCGFEVVGHDKGYANSRGTTVDEVVLARRNA